MDGEEINCCPQEIARKGAAGPGLSATRRQPIYADRKGGLGMWLVEKHRTVLGSNATTSVQKKIFFIVYTYNFISHIYIGTYTVGLLYL